MRSRIGRIWYLADWCLDAQLSPRFGRYLVLLETLVCFFAPCSDDFAMCQRQACECGVRTRSRDCHRRRIEGTQQGLRIAHRNGLLMCCCRLCIARVDSWIRITCVVVVRKWIFDAIQALRIRSIEKIGETLFRPGPSIDRRLASVILKESNADKLTRRVQWHLVWALSAEVVGKVQYGRFCSFYKGLTKECWSFS